MHRLHDLSISVDERRPALRRTASSANAARQSYKADEGLSAWRTRAKAHADGQLRLLLASPAMAAAASAGVGSRATNAAARLLGFWQVLLPYLLSQFPGEPNSGG